MLTLDPHSRRRLAVDEAWLRRKVGFVDELDEDDRAEIRESMLADDQLDAASHPHLFVHGRHCVRIEGSPDRVALELTVRARGRTKRVATILEVSQRNRLLQVRGRFRVQHRDFGITPYSAFFDAVANAEPIDFAGDFSWVRR